MAENELNNSAEIEEELKKIEAVLDLLLNGGNPEKLEEDDIGVRGLASIKAKLNQLSANIQEATNLAKSLTQGKLNDATASRKNMQAGYLKRLQSELISLVWSVGELTKGKVVSKKEANGNELFECYNRLVDQVASASIRGDGSSFAMTEEDGEITNSWRYHQILMAINKLDILVIEVDADGEIFYANQPAREMLKGRTRLVADGKDSNIDALLEHLAEQSKGERSFPIVEELHNKDSNMWYRVTSNSFSIAGGQTLYLHAVDDISDWRKTEKNLTISATTDALTGAKTRGAGISILNKVKNTPCDKRNSLVFVDINELKAVNDTFGHSAGDEYISTVAGLLLTSCRDTDMVTRYGGDEFFILFVDCTAQAAENIMQRATAKLKEINAAKTKPYTLGFSYGIKEFEYCPDTGVEELLEEADAAMYQNKLNRNNTAQ